MSVSKQKSGPRRCPLCAEVVKADAARCRFCGSTLAGMDGLDWSADAAKGAPGVADWSAPAKGDVGVAGLGAVVGALAGFGVGAWLGSPSVHVALALGGAALGGLLASVRAGGSASAPALSDRPPS